MLLPEKPYDLALIYEEGFVRAEHLPSFLTDESHAALFGEAEGVSVRELLVWALESGLRAEVWIDEDCIYALGNTEHLLWIAENIHYPLQVEVPLANDRVGEFVGGHVLNPAKCVESPTAASSPCSSRSPIDNLMSYLPASGALPPVYIGYSRKPRWKSGGTPWRTYKIPQSPHQPSLLREVDRSRLCYYGLSQFVKLHNLINGDESTTLCGLLLSSPVSQRFQYSNVNESKQHLFQPVHPRCGVDDPEDPPAPAPSPGALEDVTPVPTLPLASAEEKVGLLNSAQPAGKVHYLHPSKSLIKRMYLYKNLALYNKLAEEWANWKCLLRYDQPFELIREYLGDEICMYFHFLQTCIVWMGVASCIGLFCTVINYRSTFVHHDLKFTICRILMSVTMSVTIGVIYRRWLRIQTELKALYGISSFERGLTHRVPLPTFQFDQIVSDDVNPAHKVPVANPCAQRTRYLISLAATTQAVIIAAVFVNEDLHEYLFAKYEMRTKVEGWLRVGIQTVLSIPLSSKIPLDKIPARSIMTSMIAAFFDWLYKRICGGLTVFENHRYSEAHEYSLIRKMFLFTAFDYFLPLYNLAFVKVHYDPCYNEDPDYGRCLFSLITQMKSIIFMALVGNFTELIMPYLLKYAKACIYRRREKRHAKKSLRDIDSMSRTEYTSTSRDFGEVMLTLMIGCLFSAAWFCLPVLAFLILYTDVRVDAIKILRLNLRPYPSNGLNMSSWNFILDSLMNLTIITNVSIIAFTSFGGELPMNLKLGICFVGIIICVTAKEAVTSCGCSDESAVFASVAAAQQKIMLNIDLPSSPPPRSLPSRAGVGQWRPLYGVSVQKEEKDIHFGF